MTRVMKEADERDPGDALGLELAEGTDTLGLAIDKVEAAAPYMEPGAIGEAIRNAAEEARETDDTERKHGDR